jgi:hypothetical protein
MLRIVRKPAFYSIGFLLIFSVAAFVFICSVLIPSPDYEAQAQTQRAKPPDNPPPVKIENASAVERNETQPKPPGNSPPQPKEPNYPLSASLRDICNVSGKPAGVFDPPPAAFQEKYKIIDLAENIPLSRPSSATTTPEPATFMLLGPGILGIVGVFLRRNRK